MSGSFSGPPSLSQERLHGVTTYPRSHLSSPWKPSKTTSFVSFEAWFEVDPSKNTNVYVSGLPPDITLEEFQTIMSKYGIIMVEEETEKPKIKLYMDDHGNPKGDGRCCYLKVSYPFPYIWAPFHKGLRLIRSFLICTVEPLITRSLGPWNYLVISGFSLYQGKSIKSWDQQNYLVIEDFVISDLVITRFHCTICHWARIDINHTINRNPSWSGALFVLHHSARKGYQRYSVFSLAFSAGALFTEGCD